MGAKHITSEVYVIWQVNEESGINEDAVVVQHFSGSNGINLQQDDGGIFLSYSGAKDLIKALKAFLKEAKA